jgi:hypothetical protein
LVVAYIFAEVDEELFSNATFFWMYRDDGLVVFNSKKTKTQVQTWLNDFQLAVDELCDNLFCSSPQWCGSPMVGHLMVTWANCLL